MFSEIAAQARRYHRSLLGFRANSTYGSLRAKLGRLQLTILVRWRLARTSLSAPPISHPQLVIGASQVVR